MIKRTYEDPPTDELMQVYAAWADNYDTDLLDEHGYMAPHDAVEGFIKLGVPKDARILDCGCGTGIAGQLLFDAGYHHIDGADLSAEMRNVAAQRGIYQQLFELDMTDDYGIAPDQAYDAVICVGVFGFGPPHVEHLHHIMGAAKADAPVLITVNGAGGRAWLGQQLCPTSCQTRDRVCGKHPIRHMTKDGIDARLIELRRG